MTVNTSKDQRFFEESGFWYFKTREKKAIGPFDTLTAAQNGLLEYLQFADEDPEKFVKAFGLVSR